MNGRPRAELSTSSTAVGQNEAGEGGGAPEDVAREGTRLAAGDVSADDTWLPPLLGIVVAFGATWRDAIPADEALKLDGQLLRRLRRSQLHRLSRSQPRAGSPLRILAREAKGDLCFPAFQSGVGCAISS